MRIPSWCVLTALSAVAAAGQPPPKVLLDIPFDGSADAAFCAAGSPRTSYLRATFHPGKRGQAAELGSPRYPCGLAVRAPGIFRKDKGSLELWYKPQWDPASRVERALTRTLVTDEKPPTAVGHFWLTVAGGAVHFAWRGRTAQGVSARYVGWHKGAWRHIVVTWDHQKGLAIYTDGSLAAQRALRWQLPPADVLYIGANRRGLNPAKGLLDGLRLYDRALTPTEVELAYIDNLHAPNAPAQPAPAPAPAAGLQPRLTLHLPFDGSAEPAVAKGDPKPTVAKGIEFAEGLLGKALVCGQQIQLAYAFDKNISKEAGALTFWARSAFGVTEPRGVFLADERALPEDSKEPKNTMTLWLQRTALPVLRFEMSPAAVQRTLFRWNHMDWYHVALTWRRGSHVALYLNGELAARRAGGAADWPPEPAKLLHIGSWQGKLPARAVIDDLRVYDAPLTADQVRQHAAKFVLPLMLRLRRTLFEQGRAAQLVADVHNIAPTKLDVPLSIKVADPAGKQIAATSARVATGPRGKAVVRIPLGKAALDAEGLYRITTSSPQRVNPPISYFLVVAPEPEVAATAGADPPRPRLKPADDIDAQKTDQPARVCHSGRSTVVRAAGGSVRQAGPLPNDRFAFRFTTEAPGQPHVATITYPDDKPRSAEIVVNSRRFPNLIDVATGYLTGPPHTGRMSQLPIYFWPREAENALLFRTLIPGQPAACGDIHIQQVEGTLPPARVEPPADGGRTIGLWWREPAAPLHFGAQGLLAPDIYRSFRRLADYLRFTGQNLLGYPVAWQAGLLYPTPAEQFRLGAGGDRHCNDWLHYVLYLCERRAIRFVPELFLGDTFALNDLYGDHRQATIAAGTPTARMVMWDGALSRGGPTEPPRYTPAHPAVRAALLERIDELAGSYGSSPALHGISIHVGHSECASFGSIQCGYGDATIAQFRKHTGIAVPADTKGPGRFSQRARWLLENKYREWVAWRCRTVHALHAEAARRLAGHRADLKLYLTLAVPDAAAWHPLFGLSGLAAGTRTLDQIYKEAGIDLALYAKIPNLVVRRHQWPTDEPYVRYRRRAGGPAPHPAAAHDYRALSESYAPLRRCPLRAALASYRAFQSTIGQARPMKGLWWAAPAYRASQPTPGGRAFLAPCARAVAELDALSIAFGGIAPATMGHEEQVREFARAFRALPRRRFADIPGMADPVCARELRHDGGHIVYLVNRLSCAVDAYLAFEPGNVALHDVAGRKKLTLPVARGQRLPAAMPKGFVSEHALPAEPGPLPGEAREQSVSGALLHVQLAPYELRPYRVLTQGARVTYAAARAPDRLRLRLAQRLESAKSLLANAKAPPDVLKEAERVLKLIGRAWRKHELDRVASLLNSYPIERLR